MFPIINNRQIKEIQKQQRAAKVAENARQYLNCKQRKYCIVYFAKALECPYPILISLYDSWNLESL